MNFAFDLGILGGGQLARMSIQAAQRMGLQCLSIDTHPDTPASQLAPSLTGNWDDPETLAPVIAQCARITLENEFVPANTIMRALQLVGREPGCIVPSVDALRIIQDKLKQREVLIAAGVPCPKAVSLAEDGTRAISQIGFPMVLKARKGGYDGKGTRYARTPEEFEQHRTLWAGGGWLAEEYVPFKRELAVMVYVDGQGKMGAFPTMETCQEEHVCNLVFPAEADASKIAFAAIAAVGGSGLFGVELFEYPDGRIVVNEIAPRPHNSGHYSLDWGGISQFDQHIRVVMGLAPAPVDGLPTSMANILGIREPKNWKKAMVEMLRNDPGIRFHWYGKAEAKFGRKMGHINAVGVDSLDRVKAARDRFYEVWSQE